MNATQESTNAQPLQGSVTVTLFERDNQYGWFGNDGQQYSPFFTSREAALFHPTINTLIPYSDLYRDYKQANIPPQ